MPVPSVWLLCVLAGLLLLSGLFSASETALFTLGRARAGEAGRHARDLMERPSDLLIAVLAGNLMVNIAFFLFAQRLLGDVPRLRTEFLVGLGSLLVLVLFGEVLPKVLALRIPRAVARLGAPLLWPLVERLEPLRRFLGRLLEAFYRLLGPLSRSEPGLTAEELGALLEKTAEQGHLADSEVDLLYEVVELREVKVREIMTPRVDALFLDVNGAGRETVLRQALERRLSWLPVIEGDPDHVLGRVRVRDLLARPGRSPRQLLLPVKFVPEVASCLDLLHTLREERLAEALVVDEWGGTAGVVDIENVFEEIVGELRKEGESRDQPVVPLGEGRFRVDGGLSIRDWNEVFGSEVVPNEFETLGGFVTAQLGRIPRVGDDLDFGHLHLRVHEVRGRRVIAVDIGVQAPAEAGA